MIFSPDAFGEQPYITCGLAALLGVCVGSFLNVAALRSLKEESFIFPASHCMSCNHSLSLADNIPILSYMFLGGKCRYCSAGISVQYPIVEAGTGLAFALVAFIFLVLKIPYCAGAGDLFSSIAAALKQGDAGAGLPPMPLFQKVGLAVSMAAFVSTLIAVTVTDLREKLIPHEITYPSMIFGILSAAVIRQDLLGTMAGIGASYIIFDFLAFYGLKLYLLMHPEARDDYEEENPEADTEPSDDEVDRTFGIAPANAQEEEPLEVMGGGDAVLSAVMSAYLGWQLLVVALIIGFAAGTLGGIVLLVREMKKAGLLATCFKRAGMLAVMCGCIFGVLVTGLTAYFQTQAGDTVDFTSMEFLKPILFMVSVGSAGGALIGIVTVGTQVSKPFPFGPALALGGLCCVFLVPFWLPFF